MIESDCTDVLSVVDNRTGRLEHFGRRTAVSGIAIRTGGKRTYQTNTMSLRIAQEELAYWESLRNNNCKTCIQIRECPPSLCDWQNADVYTGVEVDNIIKSQQTAQGVNTSDLARTAVISLLWQDLLHIQDLPPLIQDQGDKGLRNSVVGVTFCACASCCAGLEPCDTVYRLLELGRIEVSYNGGLDWQELETCLPCSGSLAITCYNGRIFVSLLAGLYYTSNPDDPLSWQQSIGGTGIFKFARFGAVFYGLGEQDGSYVVWRSIDGGNIFSIVYTTTQKLNDIAAAGPTVVVVGDDSFIAVSFDTGDNWEERLFNSPIGGRPDLLAVDLTLRDEDDLKCFVAYVSDGDNNIYRGDLDTWRRVYDGSQLQELCPECPPCTEDECAPAHLFIGGCGQLSWYNRSVCGHNITLRSAGDCFTWLRYEDEQSNENCDELIDDHLYFGCVDDEGEVLGLFACCSQELPCEVADKVLFGCVDDEGEVLIFRCIVDCEEIYFSWPQDCSNCEDECDCPNCTNCIDEADIIEVDIPCDELVVFGIPVEDAEECGDPEVVCVGCCTTTVAAVCPTNPNKFITIGSSVIDAGCDFGCDPLPPF